MTAKRIAVLALCLVATACFAADNPQLGTWKFNKAKSKITSGVVADVVKYEAKGDQIVVSVDAKDAAGKPMHSEWIGKFDGKDYALKGDPNGDMRAYKQVDAHTVELTTKKGGKVTTSGKIVVSADGKSRTVTIKGTNPNGEKQDYTAAYDKQ